MNLRPLPALTMAALLVAACGASPTSGAASSASSQPTSVSAGPTESSSGSPASPTGSPSASSPVLEAPFVAADCPTDGGYQAVLDCYLEAATASLDARWADAFAAEGTAYSTPKVQAVDTAITTACGDATADAGPFYCPADQTIYLQSEFMTRIGDQAGAEGPYSGVVVLAHEWGHHVQALLGMDEEFDASAAEKLGSVNAASVRSELMADCLAGWWTGRADQLGTFPATEQDLTDAMLSLAEVGDDFDSVVNGAEIEPDTWDHGTLDQRTSWLTTGIEAGMTDANPFTACDTFTITAP